MRIRKRLVLREGVGVSVFKESDGVSVCFTGEGSAFVGRVSASGELKVASIEKNGYYSHSSKLGTGQILVLGENVIV